MANKFIIEVRTKGFAGAERDLDKVKKKTDQYSKSSNKMRLQTSSVRRELGVLRNNLLLVGFAVGSVTALINKNVKAYRSQIEAETKLRRSLANVASASADGADKLIQLAAALQKVTTFGDEQIIAGQAMLATFQLNEDAIAALTPRMLDMAAATGKDMVASAMLLGKAFTGQVSALSEAGIIIDKIGIKSARSAGPVKEFAFLAGELDKNFQGVARAIADTDVGKLDQIANKTSDLHEQMGKVSVPIANLFANIKLQFTSGLSLWSTFISKLFDSDAMKGLNSIDQMRKAYEETLKVWQEMNATGNPQFGTPETLTTLEKTIAGIKEQALMWKLVGIEAGNSITTVTALTGEQIDAMANMHPLLRQRMVLQAQLQEQQRINSATEQAGQIVTTAQAVRYAEIQVKIKKNAQSIHQAELKGTAQMLNSFSALAGSNKGNALAAAKLSQAAALIDMYAGANKAFAQGGVLGFVTGASIIAQGLANIAQIESSLTQMQSAETGFDGVVTEPTLFMTGEGGKAERVSVTPLQGPNINGPQGSGITINISAPLVDDTVIDHIIPAIQKAQRLNLA